MTDRWAVCGEDEVRWKLGPKRVYRLIDGRVTLRCGIRFVQDRVRGIELRNRF